MTSAETIKFAAQRLIILKVLGFLSISIEDGKSVTKLMDVVYFVFGIIFGVSMCYLSLIRRQELGNSSSKLADYGNFLGFIGSVVISMISMFINFGVRHKTWNFVLRFARVEDEFASINFPVDYSKANKVQMLFACLLTSLMFPITLWTYYTDGSILKIFLYLYAGFYFTVGVGGITLFVVAVYHRLTTISQILELRVRQKSDRKPSKSFSNDEVLATVARIYQELMEICDDMNFCYGIQIMIAFGLMFFYTLFTFFTAYTDILMISQLNHVTISSICFALYYNSVLLVVIFCCRLANKEAEQVTKHLKNLMKKRQDPVDASMLFAFSFLLRNQRPNFNCGLFDYDWRLVYAIVATASSNFVILIQFDLAEKRNLT